MKNRKFTGGDIVRLKSGGGKMTVSSYNGSWVYCWFTYKERVKSLLIPEEVLVECNEPS